MADSNARQKAMALKAISLLDLTSLNDNDSEESIAKLCEQAATADEDGTLHHVAALCIYPRFIPFARHKLDELGYHAVRLATVSNFPHGRADIDSAVKETRACVAYGADEVDVVFPYRAFLAGDDKVAANLITACKAECGTQAQLKVILETGALKSEETIRRASDLAIFAGADFIKTSTGKVETNATPEAARQMLEAIAAQARVVGFKPAGGVRSPEDVSTYFRLAEDIVGPERLTPAYFRFGASSLLQVLNDVLSNAKPTAPAEGY